MIKFLFKDEFIPTLNNDLKLNDEYVLQWPPISFYTDNIVNNK